MLTTPCVSGVTFHVSHVMCHVSHVMCYVSGVTIHESHVTLFVVVKKNIFIHIYWIKTKQKIILKKEEKIYKVGELVGGGYVINVATPSSFHLLLVSFISLIVVLARRLQPG